MIIRILLSLGLIFILLFYLANSRRGIASTLVALFGAGSGLVVVWNPELANEVAQILGLGRGADLIFYCWVMISMALFLTLHFKVCELQERLTNLVRETAIEETRAKRRTPGAGS